MTNSYQYSIKINEALERYGAKTCGSLERRVARLKRFTTLTNQKYAEEIRLEDARMMAREERQQRVDNRIREILEETEQKAQPRGRINRGPSPKRRINRSLLPEFERMTTRSQTRYVEEEQEVEIPARYTTSGLNLLWEAIQNGFVNTRRGSSS
jgi:hypothetical protein